MPSQKWPLRTTVLTLYSSNMLKKIIKSAVLFRFGQYGSYSNWIVLCSALLCSVRLFFRYCAAQYCCECLRNILQYVEEKGVAACSTSNFILLCEISLTLSRLYFSTRHSTLQCTLTCTALHYIEYALHGTPLQFTYYVWHFVLRLGTDWDWTCKTIDQKESYSPEQSD